MQDLTLKIGMINHIEIDEAQAAHAGGGEIKRERRAEATGTDQKNRGRLEALLTFDRHLRHDQMPRVTGDFLVGKLDLRGAFRIKNRVHAQNTNSESNTPPPKRKPTTLKATASE